MEDLEEPETKLRFVLAFFYVVASSQIYPQNVGKYRENYFFQANF